jgi:hypothetical protein
VAVVGENILDFAGTAQDGASGASIGNVELLRKGKCGLEDPLLNGNFVDRIKASGEDTHVYSGGVKGWKGAQIEVGRGTVVNSNWGNSDYVAILRPGSDIYQSVFLDYRWEQTSADQAALPPA